MSSNSRIEWTETTWNPVVGCTKVSPGCANCYAETMSARLAGMARADMAKGNNPGRKAHYSLVVRTGHWNNNKLQTVPEALADPFKWRKPRRVFVNSMSDLFHQDVPFDFIDRVFAVMALTPQHTYQVLTKRPERMAEYMDYAHGKPRTAGGPDHPMILREPTYYWQIERWLDEGAGGFFKTEPAWNQAHKRAGEVAMIWPLPSVWLGTSVENQVTADERIPHLLRCPAAVRFLSMEPLLGAVDLTGWRKPDGVYCDYCGDPAKKPCDDEPGAICPWKPLSGIHWVIVGGESGPGARPMHPDWARSIRDQCAAAGVPFFMKQMSKRDDIPQDLVIREFPNGL